jgi:hypothetical protein
MRKYSTHLLNVVKHCYKPKFGKYGCGYFNTIIHITYSICTQLMHDGIIVDVSIFFLNLKLVALIFKKKL